MLSLPRRAAGLQRMLRKTSQEEAVCRSSRLLLDDLHRPAARSFNPPIQPYEYTAEKDRGICDGLLVSARRRWENVTLSSCLGEDHFTWIREELKIAFCHLHFQHPCAWQYLGKQRNCETFVICIDFSTTRNPGTSQQTVGSNQPWAQGSTLYQCRSTAGRSKRTSCSQPWHSTVVVMRISWLKLGLSGYSGG
jgi:hypothetical protein